MQLKVLSYNIHKGFHWHGSRLSLHLIREAIRRVDADIVFLQEVIGENARHAQGHEDWPLQSQFEYLADSVWEHYAYARNAVYEEGHHGNAILSKYPIVLFDHQDISTNRLEQRGLLHGVVDLNLNSEASPRHLHVFNVHLNLLHRSRKVQFDAVATRVRDEVEVNAPVIVAGDFNDWGGRAHATFENRLGMREVFREIHGGYARTFPSFYPLLSLDRIYVRNLNVTEAATHTSDFWRGISDHAALSATLSMP